MVNTMKTRIPLQADLIRFLIKPSYSQHTSVIRGYLGIEVEKVRFQENPSEIIVKKSILWFNKDLEEFIKTPLHKGDVIEFYAVLSEYQLRNGYKTYNIRSPCSFQLIEAKSTHILEIPSIDEWLKSNNKSLTPEQITWLKDKIKAASDQKEGEFYLGLYRYYIENGYLTEKQANLIKHRMKSEDQIRKEGVNVGVIILTKKKTETNPDWGYLDTVYGSVDIFAIKQLLKDQIHLTEDDITNEINNTKSVIGTTVGTTKILRIIAWKYKLERFLPTLEPKKEN